MSDLIFHHFDQSPYSEKIRLIFGLKGLTWNSVVIPRIMPKPDFVALTGGYRQTPALQVGAHIYCDTQLIVRELEKYSPTPSLYASGGRGANEALSAWTDAKLFRPCVRYIFGTYADNLPVELLADRERMAGRDLDIDLIKNAAEPLLIQALSQMSWIEDMLSDGQAYLLGDSPALADFAVYHCIWFMKNTPKGTEQLQKYATLNAWFERMKSIGQGTRVEMEAAAALKTAKDNTAEIPKSDFIGYGPQIGSQVSISTETAIPEPVIGELVVSSLDEIAVRRVTEEAGETIVHFPRLGYMVTPA